VLHTCSEARLEGLKHYTACAKRCSHNFYNRHVPWYTCENQGCVSKHVYVNFNTDRFLCRNFPDGALLDEYQLDKKDLAMIQFLDIECKVPWLWGLSHFNPILLGGRLKVLNIVVKKQACGEEPFLPNTIDRELSLKEYKKKLMNYIERYREKIRKERRVSEDEEDEGCIYWQLPEGVELTCKWSWVAEEFDLVPISVGASAGYVAAGGVLENAFDMW